MVTRTKIAAAVITVMGVGMVIASAESGASGDDALTFRLGLNVPTICRIDIHGPSPATDNDATAEEFCNAPAGYRVFAIHPAPRAGDPLWFDYGGRRVPASSTGMTTLAEEPTAAHRLRTFAVIHTQQGKRELPAISLSNITLQIVLR